MSNVVRHRGVIEKITMDKIRVRIVSMTSCEGCGLAGHCHTMGDKAKYVEVSAHAESEKWKIGDEVTVAHDESKAFKAVLLGYGFPLLLLVCCVLVVNTLFGKELLAALAGIASVLFYYLLLHFFNGRIQQQYMFKIEDKP